MDENSHKESDLLLSKAQILGISENCNTIIAWHRISIQVNTATLYDSIRLAVIGEPPPQHNAALAKEHSSSRTFHNHIPYPLSSKLPIALDCKGQPSFISYPGITPKKSAGLDVSMLWKLDISYPYQVAHQHCCRNSAY